MNIINKLCACTFITRTRDIGSYLALSRSSFRSELEYWRSKLAMLLTVQVAASLGRLVVPWSIIELNDEGTTFAQLFQMIQAGSFEIIQMNDDLKRSTLSGTFVGAARDALVTINNSYAVLRVCSQFGYYVKFTVDVGKETPVTPPAINAFAIMAAAQRRLQLGNNGLPFP